MYAAVQVDESLWCTILGTETCCVLLMINYKCIYCYNQKKKEDNRQKKITRPRTDIFTNESNEEKNSNHQRTELTHTRKYTEKKREKTSDVYSWWTRRNTFFYCSMFAYNITGVITDWCLYTHICMNKFDRSINRNLYWWDCLLLGRGEIWLDWKEKSLLRRNKHRERERESRQIIHCRILRKIS
jgi:hypothetical protein